MAEKYERAPCHVQWGDRVDHRIMGFGTVVGEPVAMSGPIEDRTMPGGYRDGPKGYSVTVKWDDPSKREGTFGCRSLQLVTRPNAKGSGYWNNEYEKLLAEVMWSRRLTDAALKSGFRPKEGDSLSAIERALMAERGPMERLANFLAEENKGEHH